MSWDDFASAARANSRGASRKCTMGHLLWMLGPEATAAISAVMDDTSITSRAIRTALADRVELDVPSVWTINRHRRKDCACNPGRGYNT